MPNPAQNSFLPDNVVPDPVGPVLQAPLTYSLPLELLDPGGWTARIRLEASDRVEVFLMTRLGDGVEIALETWGQANKETGRHLSAGPAGRQAILQVVPQAHRVAHPVLLGSGPAARLELGIKLFQDVVEVRRTEDVNLFGAMPECSMTTLVHRSGVRC